MCTVICLALTLALKFAVSVMANLSLEIPEKNLLQLQQSTAPLLVLANQIVCSVIFVSGSAGGFAGFAKILQQCLAVLSLLYLIFHFYQKLPYANQTVCAVCVGALGSVLVLAVLEIIAENSAGVADNNVLGTACVLIPLVAKYCAVYWARRVHELFALLALRLDEKAQRKIDYWHLYQLQYLVGAMI